MESLHQLEERLGYTFTNIELLRGALYHSSYANEHRAMGVSSNERLEFLGDAVLGFVSADFLYRKHPDLPEGELTRIRAALVCEESLYEVAQGLHLGEYLLLGKGEINGGGNKRPSVLSDAVEAVLAAIYLDGGIKNAKNFILKFLEPKIRLSECNNNNFYDYKSMLNEFAGKHSLAVRYEDALNDESALQKQKFEFIVYIDGEEMGKGAGGSKKEAQQMAAKVAYKKLITNK